MPKYIQSYTGAINAKGVPGKVSRLWVRNHPGLFLKITATGKKNIVFQYREIAPEKTYEERRLVRVQFDLLANGPGGAERFEAACEKALEWRKLIRHGIDPREKERAELLASMPAPSKPAKKAPTFAAATRGYLMSRKKLASSSMSRYRMLARRGVHAPLHYALDGHEARHVQQGEGQD